MALDVQRVANCPNATMNDDCMASAQVTSFVSRIDRGFTATSTSGFHYDGIAFLASQGARMNPLGCPTTVGVSAPESLALAFPALLLLFAPRRRSRSMARDI